MASDSKSHSDSFGDSSTPTFGAHLAAAKKSPAMEGDDVYMTGTENSEANELGNVKKRSQETEDESAGFQELEDTAVALREMQANVEKEMDPLHGIAFGESSARHINKKAKVAPSVFGQASTSSVGEQVDLGKSRRARYIQSLVSLCPDDVQESVGSGVAFGDSSTPIFGAPSTPIFGASSAPSSSFPAFGQSISGGPLPDFSWTLAFGASPSFGALSSTSSLSGQSNSGGLLPAGQSDGAIFGVWAAALSSLIAQSPFVFGATISPAFGATSTPTFGASAFTFPSGPLLGFRAWAASPFALRGFGASLPALSGPLGQPISAFGQADRELLSHIPPTHCKLLADGSMQCLMCVDRNAVFRSLDEHVAHVKRHFSPLLFIEYDSETESELDDDDDYEEATEDDDDPDEEANEDDDDPELIQSFSNVRFR